MMRPMYFVRLLAGLAVALLVAADVRPQPAPALRVALVVGVDNYASAGKLSSARNDAKALEAALSKLGFKVTVATDPSRQALSAAIDEFVQTHRRSAELALFFFAGHGVQIDGRNYLLPTDASIRTATELANTSLALDDVVDRLFEAARRRIVLIDACRNNPFGHLPADAAPALAPGFAETVNADWTAHLFATAPGRMSAGGTDGHSPFTQALLAHLGKAQGHTDVLKLVQMDVYDGSAGFQIPHLDDRIPEMVPIAVTDVQRPLEERDSLLLAMAEIGSETRGQVERIAKESDIPLAPLYGALLATGLNLPVADRLARERILVRAADEFVNLRQQLRTFASSDPEVARLREEATRQLALGAFEAARAAWRQAIDIDLAAADAATSLLKTRQLSAAATYALQASGHRTRLAYLDAARDFAAAAKLAAPWDRDLACEYMFNQGLSFVDHGDEFGDNAALLEGIKTYRQALAMADTVPQWLAIQNNIADTLRILSERDGNRDWLLQAIATHRELLTKVSLTETPLGWARIQSNLGAALTRLGERDNDRDLLKQAIEAFHLALKERTRERAPQDWAVTQNGLGAALLTLSEGEDRDGLEAALHAFSEALSETPRDRLPLQWGRVLGNLAVAYTLLGMRENDALRLRRAVEAYREAREEITRERLPILWADNQNNLGGALARLGDIEGDSAWFVQAIEAFEEALKERTRTRLPAEWARTQSNLGDALTNLGVREDSVERLGQAIACLKGALEVFEAYGFSVNAARARERLEVAEAALAKRSK